MDKSLLFLFYRKESAFFFEKKKQKTFDHGASPWRLRPEKGYIMRKFMIAAVGLLVCGPAFSHAFLESALPRVGSVIPTAPAEVVLTYTQGIEPDFSRIDVQDASGASVTAGPAHNAGSPTKFAVALKKLGAGTYTVIWHVTSIDTHKTQGKFHFSVAP